jgi:3-oxoacyl-[acyl-carrier-protein] synthase-3
MRSCAIVSTGCYVPPNEVPNEVLRARFAQRHPNAVDKLEARTGIKTRWYANPDQNTSDLVVEASREALERARLRPEDVDLILVGTDSPDYMTPATSAVAQQKLGAVNAGTFDVGCACASFPTALATAAGLIATHGALKNVLVVGAYLMERLADPMDPMIFFYGDGAGAAVVQASDSPGFVGAAFQADGNYARSWGIYAGGTAEPASAEAIAAGRTQVRMVDAYPPSINEEGWPRLVRRLAQEQSFAVEDIDMTIFTQVRDTTIRAVMGSLALPMEKTHMVMGKWGYTGSACIPMALHDAAQQGLLSEGALLVMVGSGVGYNQAAAAIRVHPALLESSK